MVHIYRITLGILAAILSATTALAICADVDSSGTISANDALTTLRAATGVRGEIVCLCSDCEEAQVSRAPGHCADLNADAATTASDALAILYVAVGVETAPACSCDACQEPAATTTTNTVPECVTQDALHGRTYVRKSRCNSGSSCVKSLVTDTIRFDHLGGGEYAVVRVPDETTLFVGTWDCVSFRGPGLLEWTFTDLSLSAFAGRGGSYCNHTGAAAPTIPPDPKQPIRCPPQI